MRIKVYELKKYKVVLSFTMYGKDFVKIGLVETRNASEAIDICVDSAVYFLSAVDKYLTTFKMNAVTVQEIK